MSAQEPEDDKEAREAYMADAMGIPQEQRDAEKEKRRLDKLQEAHQVESIAHMLPSEDASELKAKLIREHKIMKSRAALFQENLDTFVAKVNPERLGMQGVIIGRRETNHGSTIAFYLHPIDGHPAGKRPNRIFALSSLTQEGVHELKMVKGSQLPPYQIDIISELLYGLMDEKKLIPNDRGLEIIKTLKDAK